MRRGAEWLWCEVLVHKALLGFVALALGLAWALYEIEEQADRNAAKAKINRATLCALHHDIERRRDDTAAFLERDPRGIVSPKTGAIIITAAELQRSIDSQTSTLRALRRGGLRC
jgi:hypothetical protein